MGYLRLRDYLVVIQETELNQIITKSVTDPTIVAQAENAALEEITSKVKQRYDVTKEFHDTNPWSNSLTYYAGDLVELDYDAYSATSTYALGVCVTQAKKAYKCKTAITVGEAFNASKWDLLGDQYDLFYAIDPEEEFNHKKYYRVGDKVYWKNKKYTALKESVVLDHFTQLQFNSQLDIPYINVWPDDATNGLTYWGTGEAYSVPAGTLPGNTTYWKKGDNRCQQAVLNMVRIALFIMAPRVAPNNIPVTRKDGHDLAINWLMAVANGDVNAELPELQPEQGLPIMSGGNVKRINQW
jgi:hypothetical protein